mmetsp:Transcript_29918/g.71196  ORF Transcript_29918/g.71196 Transcript_29918/m.71196 type:complete len:254 (+) Transcript_29918:421-1182(+)
MPGGRNRSGRLGERARGALHPLPPREGGHDGGREPPLQACDDPRQVLVLLRIPHPLFAERAAGDVRARDARAVHHQPLPPRASYPARGAGALSRVLRALQLGGGLSHDPRPRAQVGAGGSPEPFCARTPLRGPLSTQRNGSGSRCGSAGPVHGSERREHRIRYEAHQHLRPPRPLQQPRPLRLARQLVPHRTRLPARLARRDKAADVSDGRAPALGGPTTRRLPRPSKPDRQRGGRRLRNPGKRQQGGGLPHR